MVYNGFVAYILKNRFLKHLLFWSLYMLVTLTEAGIVEEKKDLSLELIVFLFLLPIKMISTYAILYYSIPRFLIQGKFLSFFVSSTVIMALAVFSQRAIAHLVVYPLFHSEGVTMGLFCSSCLVYGFFGFLFLFGYAAALKVFKHWYIDQQTTQKLQKERLEAELKFLKAQIHPHFLFNTLNNLYALTLKKSDKAPEMVLKLSDLLNYMLYECNAERVMLEKEIDSVKNYLELEKLRYGNNMKIDLNLNGDFSNKQIAPMLILPFIENAFKHGLSDQTNNSFINISAETIRAEGPDNFDFILRIENSKSRYQPKTQNQSYKEGIGLKNVKRRLELQYKNKYELTIEDEKEIFRILLKLRICTADIKDLTPKPEVEKEWA